MFLSTKSRRGRALHGFGGHYMFLYVQSGSYILSDLEVNDVVLDCVDKIPSSCIECLSMNFFGLKGRYVLLPLDVKVRSNLGFTLF